MVQILHGIIVLWKEGQLRLAVFFLRNNLHVCARDFLKNAVIAVLCTCARLHTLDLKLSNYKFS